MLLSARILEHVSGVNDFEHAESAHFTEGDCPTVYLQLIDASRDRAEQGFSPAGRRYTPAAGAVLRVTLDNIDDDRKIVKIATQPFAGDTSIWAITVLPSDRLRGTVNLKLALTEGLKVTYAFVPAALAIESMSGVI